MRAHLGDYTIAFVRFSADRYQRNMDVVVDRLIGHRPRCWRLSTIDTLRSFLASFENKRIQDDQLALSNPLQRGTIRRGPWPSGRRSGSTKRDAMVVGNLDLQTFQFVKGKRCRCTLRAKVILGLILSCLLPTLTGNVASRIDGRSLGREGRIGTRLSK